MPLAGDADAQAACPGGGDQLAEIPAGRDQGSRFPGLMQHPDDPVQVLDRRIGLLVDGRGLLYGGGAGLGGGLQRGSLQSQQREVVAQLVVHLHRLPRAFPLPSLEIQPLALAKPYQHRGAPRVADEPWEEHEKHHHGHQIQQESQGAEPGGNPEHQRAAGRAAGQRDQPGSRRGQAPPGKITSAYGGRSQDDPRSGAGQRDGQRA